MLDQSFHSIGKVLNLPTKSKQKAQSFAIDSRKIKKGGLFFAIKGNRFDGHDFLDQAAANGAIGAIVSNQYQGSDFGLELFKVDDVQSTLQSLAKAYCLQRREKIIAITGSMGKTTTKEFLATLLAQKYKVAKTKGNENTQLTVPLTILNQREKTDFFVLEMGMSAHGQIESLVDIAPPFLSIVTQIAPAGLEDFEGGLGAVARAKAEIFSHPLTEFGLISSQVSQFEQVVQKGGCEKLIYGIWKYPNQRKELDFPMQQKEGSVAIGDSPWIDLALDATHLKENFLAAASAGRMLGLSWWEIAQGAKELRPFSRRFERVEKDGIVFINDSYNANPQSMKAAFENLPDVKGKRIGILGAMDDLGSSSEQFHKETGQLAAQCLDHVFCIGPKSKPLLVAFSKEGGKGEFCDSLADLQEALKKVASPGDVVLLKGSNQWKLWELLEK